jgi:hypothetical protein
MAIAWREVLLLGGSNPCGAGSAKGVSVLRSWRETGEMSGYWPVHPDRADEFDAAADEDADGCSLSVSEIDWTGFPGEQEECAYCGRMVPSEVPALADGAAWARLAAEHADDCDWIASRAHRGDGAGA